MFPAVITTSAIRSEGRLTGWRWLLRDITELRQSTVLLRESAIETKLDQLRSSFIQMISHELRTPMTIIVTSLELLKRRLDASLTQQQAYFDRIQQATWRINALLNDVLFYEDIESSRRSLTATRVDLAALCQTIVMQQQAEDSNHHTITLRIKGACEAVCIDQELVQQILDRLLANALKYSPQNTTVSFDVQCEGDRVHFRMHNEGAPIDQEEQARLFEPFYRPESTAHISGVGLGLAIVKRAVDAHGGTLTVESSAETGVTFKVALPKLEG